MKLDQDLINYIFEYFSKYKTEAEKKAERHFIGKKKIIGNPDMNDQLKAALEDRYFSTDEDVIKLVRLGEESFMKEVAKRIYSTYSDVLNLNLCPNCGKIARTPTAKQCRFCGYNWH